MSLLDVVPGPPVVPCAPDPGMIADAKKYIGVVPHLLRFVTPVPWVFECVVDGIKSPAFAAPAPVVELTKFIASFESSCRYCYGANRALLRVVGYSDAWIDRVERGAQVADLDEKQRAVVELTRKLARSTPRPARAEYEAVVVAYGAEAATEIAYVIATTCLMNRVATFLSLPPDAEAERNARVWYLPLIRPLVRSLIRRPARRPPAVSLDGPFHAVLDAMGPLPASFTLRGRIDAALASSHLSRRAKLLIFAVVARSMPCATTEPEATRLLAEHGLDAADVKSILENLASPKLDPLETTLVGFARGSVRYQFLEVQDRVRQDLVPRLATPALIETIGVCALANTIVRVAMLSQ